MRHFSPVTDIKSRLVKSISAKLRTACAVGVMALLAATSAVAVPITYTYHWDIISGSLDGQAITGPLTMEYKGDTSMIGPYGDSDHMAAYYDLVNTVTFGGSTFSMTEENFAFMYGYYNPDHTDLWSIGLRMANMAIDIVDKTDIAATYDIRTLAAFGPVTYKTYYDDENYDGFYLANLQTSAGLFALEDANVSLDVVFTVTLGEANAVVEPNAVPEPGSLPLLATAGAGMLLLGARRKRFLRID